MIYRINAGTSFSINGNLVCFTAYVVIAIGRKYDMINMANTPQPAIIIWSVGIYFAMKNINILNINFLILKHLHMRNIGENTENTFAQKKKTLIECLSHIFP